jgi:hypothetical protein
VVAASLKTSKHLSLKFLDAHVQILRDLARAAGSMIVSADVVRGPVMELWLVGLIRSNAITGNQNSAN